MTYSYYSHTLYISGRLIDLVTESNYLNFDDFGDINKFIPYFYQIANQKLSRYFEDDFTVDISQMLVCTIEYSFNIETEYKSWYIQFLNDLYEENKGTVFRNYRNYTVEENKDLSSSFYLKTKADYVNNKKTTFCLNIYDKQKQLMSKYHDQMERYKKSSVAEEDIRACKNILRVECKAYYEYLKAICKKFKIDNTLNNLMNIEIAEYAINHQIGRFFGSGDFYSWSAALHRGYGQIPDHYFSVSELSTQDKEKQRKRFNEIGICPYGYLPDKWEIEKLDNPIKLIQNKIHFNNK